VKEWISVKEAAVLAKRSRRAIYEWIEDKKLAMIRDERNRMLVLAKAVVRLSHEIRPGRPRGKPTRRP